MKPERILHDYGINNKLEKFDNLFQQLSISNDTLLQNINEINCSNFLIQHLALKSLYNQNDKKANHANYGKINNYCLSILYALIRQLKPANIVETGVGFGTSSAVILEALYQNQYGQLTSIDPFITEDTGILVQNKTNWNCLKNYSKNVLPNIDFNIDFFIHDSDHSYKNMLFEFNCAYTKIKKGIILSHDIGRNDAFFDFAKSKNLNFYLLPKYQDNFKKYSVGVILINYPQNNTFVFNTDKEEKPITLFD